MAAAKKDDLKAKFETATAAAKQTKKKPDNATLLKLYSYYKQATEGDAKGERPGGFVLSRAYRQSTEGDAKGERPGGFDFVGGAKHDAWSKLKSMSKDEAMTNYIKQVDKLNRE